MSKEFKSGRVLVNGIEHSLKCVYDPINVSIETQNLRTGDLWRGEFSSVFIENVTRKTGSFKEYSVFLEMLSDAIADETDHVYVELLTYSDLLALKTGHHLGKKVADNKRYLILTYKVKYDTVHYPLPLQYSGKMSPTELQDNVTKLQTEIEHLKNQIISVSSPKKKMKHSSCCAENFELRKELESLKKLGKKDQSKLINTLQEALKNLESDLIREKNKYQRSLDRKSSECKQLIEEVENLRSENRALTVKLRSVTTELNIAKRNKLHNYQLNRNSITPDMRSQPSSRSNSRGRVTPIDRRRSSSVERSRDSVERRSRGSSRERSVFTRRNSGSRSNSRNSGRSAPEVRTKARTPSPAGARLPRFDPSAYIRDKQQKIKDSNSRRDREAKTRTYLPRARSTPLERPSPSNSLYHKPPPSSIVKDIIKSNLINGRRRSGSCSSLDSCRSKSSLHSNNSSAGKRQSTRNSRGTNSRNQYKKQKTRFSYPSSGSESENKENRTRSRQKMYLNSSADLSKGDKSQLSFAKDSEIAEIDARLNALQSYLKEAQNRQYP
ncbi:hypothetical protein ACHWQZ_G008931 [Mnemiopsis leidyi]